MFCEPYWVGRNILLVGGFNVVSCDTPPRPDHPENFKRLTNHGAAQAPHIGGPHGPHHFPELAYVRAG